MRRSRMIAFLTGFSISQFVAIAAQYGYCLHTVAAAFNCGALCALFVAGLSHRGQEEVADRGAKV